MKLTTFCTLALTLTFPWFTRAQSTACDNVTNAGLICCNQALCPENLPLPIEGSIAPHGGTGALEYIWLQLRELPGSMPTWEYVPGATDPTYAPDTLFATAYFLREVRREGCTEWLTANIVTLTVLDAGYPACAASAVAQPGEADELATVRISPNPFQEKMEAYNSTDYRLTVQINDCSGKLMREIRVPAGQTTQIETIAWPAGIYVARFKNANGARAARPIVKM